MPSTRSQGDNLAPPIAELERFLYIRRRILEYQQRYDYPNIFFPTKPEEKPTMAEEGPQNRPLKFYATPSQQEPHNNIVAPAINRNDFELSVQQHQFAGNPTDDPNEHLTKFVQYADTVKVNDVSQDAIRLRLFPFSLRDRAWCNTPNFTLHFSWKHTLYTSCMHSFLGHLAFAFHHGNRNRIQEA